MKPKSYESSRAAMSSAGRQFSNLVELLTLRAETEPSRVAYITIAESGHESASINYQDLWRRAVAIGARLQEMGLAGERAMLLYPAGLDYIAAFFGCLYAGVIAIPAFPPRANRKNERLTAIVDDARPAVALTTSAFKRKAEAFVSAVYGAAPIPVQSTDDIAPDLAGGLKHIRRRPDDLAYLQYTSGSTASPKGVMISHGNVLSNLAYIDEGFEHGPESVSLSWLPHFHDMGLVDGILMPLFRGFRGLLMTPAVFLQRPILWLEAITRHRVTHTGGPNFAYDLCVRRTTPDQRRQLDLRAWSVAYNGAEPIHQDVLERFAESFAPFGFRRTAFYPAYGLAEATLKVSGGRRGGGPVYCPVDAEALERNKVYVRPGESDRFRQLVGCGRVTGETSVLIVGPETRRECDADTVGEIWVSGPGVARGFWNRPDESEDVFRAFTADTRKGPFLRTGDLGFVRAGELYVTGRLKDLIIIRGRNLYPQDIEATASASHPGLRPGGGAAFSIDNASGERLVVLHELESRKAENADQIISAIRQAVSQTHEVQVHGIVLLRPGTLPRTSSGKTQRKSCRRLFLSGELEEVARWLIEPGEADEGLFIDFEFNERDVGDLASALQDLIARKLGISQDHVSLTEPLSRFGLDSLASVEIAHEIETRLKSPVPMAAFLADTTILRLAEDIASGTSLIEADNGFERGTLPGESKYPLSPGQQAIWFIYQMDPLSAAYNMAGAVRITSKLNANSLRKSFQALVDRHQSLRATFGSERGVAYQRIRPESEVYFKELDASEWSAGALRREVEQEAARPFDLENGPPFRVALYRLAPDQHVLLIAVHHIVADFWSLSVLLNELGKIYEGGSNAGYAQLPELTSTFADFVKRQAMMLNDASGEAHWNYWSLQLAGELPSLALPIDKERPRVQTYRGAGIPFRIGAELLERAGALSGAVQTTLFVTLLAAFKVLLSKYCGQDEILVGTPTSGRTSSDFASVVGYFVNPVVIRSVIGPAHSFRDTVARVKETVVQALYHQEYPFSEIVKRLKGERDASRSPLFQAMFALQKSHLDGGGQLAAISLGDPDAHLEIGPLELSAFPIEQRIAQFDISLSIAETGIEASCLFEYNTDLFETSTIERMSGHFLSLLDALLSTPFAPVSNATYITEVERRRLLDEWGDNCSGAYDFVPVHQQFEGNAAAARDSVAAVEGDSVLTYGELDARANKLRDYLIAAGVRQETPVVLLVQRSLEMVVALMAVLKSGGAYVPIDPSTPVSRVEAIVRDVRPAAVLTHANLAGLVDGASVSTFSIDEDWDSLTDSSLCFRSEVEADSVCYIIYTSGSTGVPKGVAVRHSSLSRYLRSACSYYEISRQDRVLQFSSLSFDASVDEIFVPLTSGGSLVINVESATTSPDELLQQCSERMISVLSLPTAYWHAVVPNLSANQLASATALRLAIIGGESGLEERLSQWTRNAGQRVKLVNSYGPTETTVAVTFWTAGDKGPRPGSRLPIGRPISGSYTYVLDIHGDSSPTGVQGEICIGGYGLARGYFNDPGRTAERFAPDPFARETGARVYRSGDLGRFTADGNLECLGRVDRQLKVRGFRVEPGDIEAALTRIAGVNEAVVIADKVSGNKLVAYVVLKGESTRDPQLLRDALTRELPPSMIPAHFVFLDELPKNTAGKIDRRSLPVVQFRCEPGSDEAGSEVERKIAEIWAQVLGVPGVHRDDNFFETGGDSILALQVVARASEVGIAFTPKQLFENPTVSGLAAAASTAADHWAERSPIGSTAPLTPIQRWFFERRFDEPHHWNMALILDVKVDLSFDVVSSAFSRLAAHHELLRSTFIFEGGEWRQRLSSGLAPQVREVDLRGLSTKIKSAAQASTIALEQAGLDLANGPLLRSVLFRMGSDQPDRLLIVVHHLVADAVSLRLIVADLDRSFRALTEGDAAGSPPGEYSTASAGAWASELERLAESAEVRAELEYWLRLKDARVRPLPVDRPGPNIESTASTVVAQLDVNQTDELIRIARGRYRTKVDELLIAALAEVLCDWTGGERVLIEIERHGREAAFGIDIDLSRSIGWFTATFPALIRLDSSSERMDSVRRVKESLRATPSGGTGFGLLRYVVKDEDIRTGMTALPEPEVSFNYLGDLDRSFERFDLFGSPEIINEGSRSPSSARTHLLEVDAAIVDRRLKLYFRFSRDVFETNTIERLASSFVNRLASLMDQGSAGAAAFYSTSDFPLAKLSQSQLDMLVGADRGIQKIYPLSPSQKGMLFHAVYSHDRDVYAGTLLLSITGDLDEAAFEAAWRQVVRRHPILRTSFAWEQLSEPVQVVHQRAELSVTCLDSSRVQGSSLFERLRRLADDEQARGFDLTVAPLTRTTLVRVSDQRHYFLLALHHLIIDGWSLSLLFNEVFGAYERIRGGEAPELKGQPESFEAYIAWIERQDRSLAEKFWREELRGISSPLELPIGIASGEGPRGPLFSRRRIVLSAFLTSRLMLFARQNQLTLSTAVQGAWAALLARYSGAADLLFGSVTSGRPSTLVRAQEIIGPLTVTLPTRVRWSADRALGPWLKALQDRQIEARQFDYCSLVDVQGWTGIPRGRPLFESIVAFENYPLDVERLGSSSELTVELIESVESTNYPLTIVVFPGDHLALEIIFQTDRFEEAAVERLAGHVEVLLSGFPDYGTRPVSSVPMLSERETDQILVKWPGEPTLYPGEKTIAALFCEQADQSPDAVAVVFADRQVTYAELNVRAGLLARFLVERGAGPETVVGISTERSVEMIVGLVAIIRAGAAYLPVDLSYASERTQFVLANSGANLILAPISTSDAPELSDIEIISITEITGTLENGLRLSNSAKTGSVSLSPEPRIQPENLAYVMYTSGSTGTPKGVGVTNRGVVRLVKNTNYLCLSADEVFFQSSTLSFDASTFEIWGALLNGAKLVVMAAGTQSLEAITDALKQHQVTVAFFTTGLFHLLVQERLESVSAVKYVLTGGEAAAIEDARAVVSGGSTGLINVYGPTEATTFTTYHLCQDGLFRRPTVPIGRPISNTSVYILDNDLNALPVGISGELYIGGDGLARGYVAAGGLTAERFVPNPFNCEAGQRLYRSGDVVTFLTDGDIEFLRRLDSQVKIRGFRVEPGEIEAALAVYPGIRQCAVVAQGETAGDKRLVAYLAPAAGADLDGAQIREFLRGTLPEYMIPSAFEVMESLPLTPNGKVDRRNLPGLKGLRLESSDPYIAPRNAVEETLVGIWEENLGRDEVGVRDDFFALGGHSLTAMRVISAIRYLFKVDLSVSKIFESPTIECLARELAALEAKPGQTERIARVVQRIKRMTPEERAEKLRSGARQNL